MESNTFIIQCVIVKESRLIKKQEASGLLRKLRTKIPLSKTPFVDDILF